MIELPRNLPREITQALASELDKESISDLLPALAAATARLFSAESVLMVLETESSKGVWNLQSSGFFSTARQTTPKDSALIVSKWLEEERHKQIKCDLESRLAAVSHSAFSWPYPQLSLEESLAGLSINIPKDYNLLLPISSHMVVREQGQTNYFGYLLLLFDNFPSLRDAAVQLIITLPPLLSDIVNCCDRRRAVKAERELDRFVEETSNYLQLSGEVVELVKAGEFKRAKKLLPDIEHYHHLLRRRSIELSETNHSSADSKPFASAEDRIDTRGDSLWAK